MDKNVHICGLEGISALPQLLFSVSLTSEIYSSDTDCVGTVSHFDVPYVHYGSRNNTHHQADGINAMVLSEGFLVIYIEGKPSYQRKRIKLKFIGCICVCI